MDETTLGGRIRQAAEEVAHRVGEIAQQTNELIGDKREAEKLTRRIRALEREKDRCRLMLADLAVRMFDRQAFSEKLLLPDYERIKEIEAEIAQLQEEREAIGAQDAEVAACPDPGTK